MLNLVRRKFFELLRPLRVHILLQRGGHPRFDQLHDINQQQFRAFRHGEGKLPLFDIPEKIFVTVV